VHFPHNGRVRTRLAILSAVLFFSLPVFAKKKSTPLPVPPRASTSREYVSALSAGNRFLQAWQAEDHEAGLLMLTDSAKRQSSAERLEKYFSPDSATERAYHIAHGNKLKGRYGFPVRLFERSGGTLRSRSSQMIVVQTGKDDWAVDRLP
jgi:hypothetical protein